MAKKHKIKNYSDKTNFFGKKRKNNLLKPLLSVVLLGLFVFVGISAYQPVKDYVTGNIKPNPLPDTPSVVSTDLTPTLPEAIPVTEVIEEKKPAPVVIDNLNGVIMPTETALDNKLTDDFLNTLPEGTNAVIITVKDSQGKILYSTSNANAVAWDAPASSTIDIKQLKEKLEAKGLALGVRFSVFSDPIAARGNIGTNAIMHSSGVVWIDNTLENSGKPWTTPYSQPVREYNIQLIKELSELGAKVIVLDYMRFPNDPTASANLKETEGVSRNQILDTFYTDATTALEGSSVRLCSSVDLWTAQQGESGLNQSLYGGDPMGLTVNDWVVSIEDIDVTSPEITQFISDQSGKAIVLLTLQSANQEKLSSSDMQYILY